jgi:TolB protein
MRANGTDYQRLTNWSPYFFLSPDFSPTRKKIAFVTGPPFHRDVYVMRPDGTHQQNLTGNPADDSRPSFSPDGERIAFASGAGNDAEIFVMRVDGTHRSQLTHNSSDDAAPSFSPNGRRIAFESDRRGNGQGIFVMRADGSHQHLISAAGRFPDWGVRP